MGRAKIGVVIHLPLREELFSPEDKARLEALGEVVWTDSPAPLTVEEAIARLADCEVGVGSWGTPRPDPVLLPACPKLRLWEHVAGSVKGMFGPHLEGRDLVIASCAAAIAENVAEVALGELIVGLKRILENAAANRAGRGPKPANSKPLHSSVIGVIGASQVGRRLIRLLKPFAPTILLYDPYVSAAEAAQLGAQKVSDLVELCARSNAVTLHAPALPSTAKMLGAREFGAMRDDTVFINTARGRCVDEAALIAELEKGRLFAFLDVSEPEPAAEDSPLRRRPNVVYTSHIAGQADFKMGQQAVDDIAAFLGGGSPRMAVTAEMLERVA